MDLVSLHNTFIKSDDSILHAIAQINSDNCGIALVVDENNKLLGTITDGDIRRALLKGISLEDPASLAMFSSPFTCLPSTPSAEIKQKMELHKILQIPIVDQDGCVIDLALSNVLKQPKRHENEVIIMAGGIGQRLRPLTENIPKPMLEVNGRPILHYIIENLVSQGLYKFTICLNYLGDMIEDYFEDGSKFGASITYTRENRRMGTGGALSLLKEPPNDSCIVINGDILTKLDFRSLRDFHISHKAMATVSLNEYVISIPFGVIETNDGMITQMIEKPDHKSFVNAGIYMLSPSVFDYIKADTKFDMPDLMEILLAEGKGIAGFPIFEQWLDIGRHSDLEKARNGNAIAAVNSQTHLIYSNKKNT